MSCWSIFPQPPLDEPLQAERTETLGQLLQEQSAEVTRPAHESETDGPAQGQNIVQRAASESSLSVNLSPPINSSPPTQSSLPVDPAPTNTVGPSPSVESAPPNSTSTPDQQVLAMAETSSSLPLTPSQNATNPTNLIAPRRMCQGNKGNGNTRGNSGQFLKNQWYALPDARLMNGSPWREEDDLLLWYLRRHKGWRMPQVYKYMFPKTLNSCNNRWTRTMRKFSAAAETESEFKEIAIQARDEMGQRFERGEFDYRIPLAEAAAESNPQKKVNVVMMGPQKAKARYMKKVAVRKKNANRQETATIEETALDDEDAADNQEMAANEDEMVVDEEMAVHEETMVDEEKVADEEMEDPVYDRLELSAGEDEDDGLI